MKEKLSVLQILLAVVLSLAALIIGQLPSQALAGLLQLSPFVMIFVYFVAGTACILAVYFLLKLLCEGVLKSPLERFRISKLQIKPAWLICALLLPASVSVAISLTPGVLTQNAMHPVEIASRVSLALFVIGFGPGVTEELVFRGVIMYSLENRFGKPIAIIIPSVFFALLHAFGTNLDALSLVFLLVAGTLVGVMFSLITYATGSVWNSALIHGLWNTVILGGIFKIGSPTFLAPSSALYTYELASNSFLVTGGKFGIESSAIATAAYVIVSIIAFAAMKSTKKA
ncbi:MAG: type II CAAX endopeptidase family protein [Candidatus Pelethousia sp.]|nr:type II CAAX endopeptidase family protein [Candidatus Pelethousia sp.]